MAAVAERFEDRPDLGCQVNHGLYLQRDIRAECVIGQERTELPLAGTIGLTLVKRERGGEISIGFTQREDAETLGTGQGAVCEREVGAIGEGGVVSQRLGNFGEPAFVALFQRLGDRQMQFGPALRNHALVDRIPQ